jgi:hypothetical protein
VRVKIKKYVQHFSRKINENGSFGRPSRRRKDNIKMDSGLQDCEDVNYIRLRFVDRLLCRRWWNLQFHCNLERSRDNSVV